MTSAVKNIGSAIVETVNPFNRLVIAATSDDGVSGVAYYQTEKVKEAAAQSTYGCDSVFKALMQRLDSKSVIVQHKVLTLIRALMLEGPAGFGSKIATTQTRFFTLAQLADVRRDSLEYQVKQLAQNILDACNGKPGALLRTVGEGDANNNLTGGSTMSTARAKSEFQEAQERELKAFRRRRDEERRSAEIVTMEKVFDSFDSSLPAVKLVASAVQTAKKKLPVEELCNFHEATTRHTKPMDVMAALDACLRDPREPIQNKYKALCLVEHMVLTVPYHEAVIYFKANSAGLQRVATLQAATDAAKLQNMVQTAHLLLRHLGTCSVPHPHVPGAPVGRPAGGSGANSRSASQSQSNSQAPAPFTIGAGSINAAFLSPDAGSVAFAGMEVRPRKPTSAEGRAAVTGGSWGATAFNSEANSFAWFDTAATQQQQAQQQYQAQQQMHPQHQQRCQSEPVQQALNAHADPNDSVRQMQEAMAQQMAMMNAMMQQLGQQVNPAPQGNPFAELTIGRNRSNSQLSDAVVGSSAPPPVPNNTMATIPPLSHNGSFGHSLGSDLRSPPQPPEPRPSPASEHLQERDSESPLTAQPVTLEMLQKLQAQMAETQAILTRQQQMFTKLQQQFMEQQNAQMAAFQRLQQQH